MTAVSGFCSPLQLGVILVLVGVVERSVRDEIGQVTGQ